MTNVGAVTLLCRLDARPDERRSPNLPVVMAGRMAGPDPAMDPATHRSRARATEAQRQTERLGHLRIRLTGPTITIMCMLGNIGSGTIFFDPGKLLQGQGKLARFVPLNSIADFNRPEIESLITAAVKLAKLSLDPAAKSTVIIKAEEQKQRCAAKAPRLAISRDGNGRGGSRKVKRHGLA